MTSAYGKAALANIPDDLRSRRQWVVWRSEERDGKLTKVPYTCHNGTRASSTDPSTWGTYDAARERDDVEGIGFVFSPEDLICGIDLDNCFNDDGKLHPEARVFVAALNSYTEVSPSGRGLHIFVQASLNGNRNRTSKTPWGGEFEVYDRSRFFTVTGRAVTTLGDKSLSADIESRQAELDTLMAGMFPPKPKPAASPVPLDITDGELIDKASKSKNGAKFTALWNGDTTGYGSQSEADLALCGFLGFWTGGDAARIRELFRSSGLYRPKWDRDDYAEKTIARALEGRTEFYGSPGSGGSPDDPDTRTNTQEAKADNASVVQTPFPDTPGQLAREPNILDEFLKDIRTGGLAGEKDTARIIYLCLTSRVLPWGKSTNRPVSAVPKGTSGSGKSHTLESVLKFFPDEAYLNLGSMSRKYLYFSDEPLSHRFLIVPEWVTIADDDELVALLRCLLSEGRVSHGTVEGEGKKKARRIEKEGPTGLLVTTTRASVDPEMETRVLSFVTDDSQEQTRRVFMAFADLEEQDDNPVDYKRWKELQLWIAEKGENRVVIPYFRALAQVMPTVAPRLRRDFVSLVCLIRAHAILHQVSRAKDEAGRIIADLSDYAVVRELVSSIVAESVDESASKATRETVEIVRELLTEEETGHTTVKKVAQRLKVGRSATYDRIKRALAGGWLVDVSLKDEKGLKLTLGTDLPDSADGFLPSPEKLSGGVQTGHLDDENPVPPAEIEGPSGSPGRPANPQGEADGLTGWTAFPEGGPCVVCEKRALYRDPSGRVRHKACSLEPAGVAS